MNARTEHTSGPRPRRFRVWMGTAALAAALATILDAGAAEAATGRNGGQAADRVDWAAVVEPALHCLQPEPNATWYVIRARVAAVGDLTRDGKRETVVVSSCPSPTSSNPLFAFVYDGASKRPAAPHLLARLGANRSFKSLKVTIHDGRVQLRGKVVSGRAPNCCPDLIVSQAYTWNGTKFRRTAEKATPIG
ncbi:hypothetical protein [Nonomuraea sp. NPDC005501]|uniref:hypothetical protein n=1 Tax=Nonomuraea sp. NPDC005501 TaxID=3156884 RepID=UPI0033BA4FBD